MNSQDNKQREQIKLKFNGEAVDSIGQKAYDPRGYITEPMSLNAAYYLYRFGAHLDKKDIIPFHIPKRDKLVEILKPRGRDAMIGPFNNTSRTLSLSEEERLTQSVIYQELIQYAHYQSASNVFFANSDIYYKFQDWWHSFAQDSVHPLFNRIFDSLDHPVIRAQLDNTMRAEQVELIEMQGKVDKALLNGKDGLLDLFFTSDQDKEDLKKYYTWLEYQDEYIVNYLNTYDHESFENYFKFSYGPALKRYNEVSKDPKPLNDFFAKSMKTLDRLKEIKNIIFSTIHNSGSHYPFKEGILSTDLIIEFYSIVYTDEDELDYDFMHLIPEVEQGHLPLGPNGDSSIQYIRGRVEDAITELAHLVHLNQCYMYYADTSGVHGRARPMHYFEFSKIFASNWSKPYAMLKLLMNAYHEMYPSDKNFIPLGTIREFTNPFFEYLYDPDICTLILPRGFDDIFTNLINTGAVNSVIIQFMDMLSPYNFVAEYLVPTINLAIDFVGKDNNIERKTRFYDLDTGETIKQMVSGRLPNENPGGIYFNHRAFCFRDRVPYKTQEDINESFQTAMDNFNTRNNQGNSKVKEIGVKFQENISIDPNKNSNTNNQQDKKSQVTKPVLKKK